MAFQLVALLLQTCPCNEDVASKQTIFNHVKHLVQNTQILRIRELTSIIFKFFSIFHWRKLVFRKTFLASADNLYDVNMMININETEWEITQSSGSESSIIWPKDFWQLIQRENMSNFNVCILLESYRETVSVFSASTSNNPGPGW